MAETDLTTDTLSREILAKLGYLVLEFRGGGSFAVATPFPSWFMRFAGSSERTDLHLLELIDFFPFLETGLMNVEQQWADAGDQITEIGEWVEARKGGLEFHLRAVLTSVGGRRLLLLCQLDQSTVDLIRKVRAAR